MGNRGSDFVRMPHMYYCCKKLGTINYSRPFLEGEFDNMFDDPEICLQRQLNSPKTKAYDETIASKNMLNPKTID